MNYIINPSWFYWISIADGIRTVLIVFSVISACACFALAIGHIIHKEVGAGFGEDDSDNIMAKKLIKPIKVTLALTVVTAIIAVFIPSRNTLIEMQIARYATYENAELTLDAIKSAVDYIVNAIQGMK